MAGEVCDSRTRSSIAAGVGPSRRDDAAALVLAGLVVGRPERFLRRLARRRQLEAAAEDRLQHGDDVGGFGDQDGALLEQAVGAFGARIERGARHGEDFAALLAGHAAR